MRRMMLQSSNAFRCLSLLFLVISSGAHAAGSVLYDMTATADASAAAPLGFSASLASPNDPDGGGLITGDILFTALSDGPVTIKLTDLGTAATGRAGSVYEAVLNGVSLGTTAATSIDGPTFSVGSFNAAVVAGNTYDLGIWDIVSTFAGSTSPYGGSVDSEFQQANVSIQVVQSIPEPSSAMLLTICLLAWAALGARTRASRSMRG